MSYIVQPDQDEARKTEHCTVWTYYVLDAQTAHDVTHTVHNMSYYARSMSCGKVGRVK